MADSSIKVTLLGTGTPVPSMDRFGPSTLVEANGRRFVFDCGRGVIQRLFQIGVPIPEIDTLLLTHLHSDHVVGIPDLWLTPAGYSGAGVRSASGGRRAPPI